MGERAISLISLDKYAIMKLDDFCNIQTQQCDKALMQLTKLRNKVVKLTWESCAVSFEFMVIFLFREIQLHMSNTGNQT